MREPDDMPIDLDAVARDDILIDALARGEDPGSDDHIMELLHRWREHLALDDDPIAEIDGFGPGFGPGADRGAGRGAGLGGGVNGFSHGYGGGASAHPDGRRTRRHARPAAHGRLVALASRRAVVAAAAAAAAVASLTGVAAAAGTADPGSPLWPITQVVSPERAHSLTARQEAYDLVSRARETARTDPSAAIELLNEAERKAGEVRTQDDQAMILATVAGIKDTIAQTSSSAAASPTGPAGPGRPTVGSTDPSTGSTTTGGTPGPGSSSGPGPTATTPPIQPSDPASAPSSPEPSGPQSSPPSPTPSDSSSPTDGVAAPTTG
jgi:hypothetical protein